MSNKGCNNCAYYVIGKINFDRDDEPRKCSLGKTEEFTRWWEINGKKKSSDKLTDMECFTETELGEILNEAINILDELKKHSEKE